MTPQELAIRRLVWVAMSELFLDTDVRLWYAATARVLADSPFSIDELAVIFKNEVAPVVGWNLLSVVGVWDGFDEDWLVSRIAPRAGVQFKLPSFAPTASDDWTAVCRSSSRAEPAVRYPRSDSFAHGQRSLFRRT